MLNQSAWLSDRALEDISDMEADLIAGGQVTGVDQLLDVRPIDVSTEPKKTWGMLSNNFKSMGLAALSTYISRIILFAH